MSEKVPYPCDGCGDTIQVHQGEIGMASGEIYCADCRPMGGPYE